jgi:AcrR family transcriptional regulator
VRYSKDHKLHSRETIIQVAAALFREHGYEAVSIDTLMSAAGMTRGGFYGHFKSKLDLYEAVLSGDHDFIQRMQSRDGTTPEQLVEQGAQVTDGYLHPDNRQDVIGGCSLAALAMDTVRSSDSTQRVYAQVVRDLVEEFGRGIPGGNLLDERALVALATCVGGLLLSSACAADAELSDAISHACSTQVRTTLQSNA